MEKLELEKKLIIFDLDGTLIDSSNQIISAVVRARSKFHLKLAEKEFLNSQIGLPARELFSDLKLTEPEVVNVVETFRKYLRASELSTSDVFPKVPDLLLSLKNLGLELSVATNKPTDLAKIALRQTGLLNFFKVVLGSDNLMPKPDPAIIQGCIMHFQIKSSEAVMIGDRCEDMIAAKLSGASGVGVLQGCHNSNQLLEAGAVQVFSDISEILELINKGESFDNL